MEGRTRRTGRTGQVEDTHTGLVTHIGMDYVTHIGLDKDACDAAVALSSIRLVVDEHVDSTTESPEGQYTVERLRHCDSSTSHCPSVHRPTACKSHTVFGNERRW